MKRYVLGIVAILTLVNSCDYIEDSINFKIDRRKYTTLYPGRPIFGERKGDIYFISYNINNDIVIQFRDDFISNRKDELTMKLKTSFQGPTELYKKYPVSINDTWIYRDKYKDGDNYVYAVEGYVEFNEFYTYDYYKSFGYQFTDVYISGNFEITFEYESDNKSSVMITNGSFENVCFYLHPPTVGVTDKSERSELMHNLFPILEFRQKD